MLFVLLQIKSFAFSQTPSKESGNYIITFNPVYASGLIDISYVSFEDLYLIVFDRPIKIDSVMAALSKKSYSKMSDILDTFRKECKVYAVAENNSKKKHGIKINKRLSNNCYYGRRFLFPLSDTVIKSSSLVGFVVSRYIFLEARFNYKVLKENCGDFHNECRVVITKL